MYRAKRIRQAGVSLQELLITLAIVGILAIVTIPNFNAYMKVSRAKTAVSELVGAIRIARQISVTTRDNHTVVTNATTHTWGLWRTIPLEPGVLLRSGEMPAGVTIEVAHGIQFDSTGKCLLPTVYSGTTPTSNYVSIEAVIEPDRTDRFTLEVSSVGRIKITRDVVVP